MFSRSRPDLADAYICGTYHTRGKAGCTTHHIRVDVLDRELKRYIAKVCENSEKMIKQLETEISFEPNAVKDSAKAAEELAKLIEQEKDSLKILMRQKSRDLARAKGNEDVLMETYDALIEESANRIHGLENQIAMTADTRNTIIRANRHAKTVLDIFHDILSKEKLDKRDIGLIVDRIIVYENRIEIKLRGDVDALLRCDDEAQTEEIANFNGDTENIERTAEKYNSVVVQSAKNQADKVFRVNVISGGEPLEIYTEKDGEIIFKKYSPIGDISAASAQCAEAISKSGGYPIAICDKDSIIAVAGTPSRKEYLEKPVSLSLSSLMARRREYSAANVKTAIELTDGGDGRISCFSPIIADGDVVGAVMSLMQNDGVPTETEQKLVSAGAMFLAKQTEI